MRIFVYVVLMILSGIFGLIFFLGDNESLLKLILSKPVGAFLLVISYVIHDHLRKDYQSYIKNN